MSYWTPPELLQYGAGGLPSANNISFLVSLAVFVSVIRRGQTTNYTL